MTTIPADLLYFLSPVNTPVYPIPENAKIIVTEARNRDDNKRGEIMPVNNIWHDDLRLWYRGEDGNYYDGPMIGHGIAGRSYAIDVVGDEAVFGYISARYTVPPGRPGATIINTARWSGERVSVNGYAIPDHCGVNFVAPAQWANELWPTPTDSDDMRAAKIALAKHKWETQIKHLAIIREGQRRDWLHILEQKDFLSEEGMPRPVYGGLVTGAVNLPTNEEVQADALTARTQTQLNTITQFRNHPDQRSFNAQIQVPVQFVYPGGDAYRSGANIYAPEASTLTAHFQAASNNYELTVTAHSVQPTITAVTN